MDSIAKLRYIQARRQIEEANFERKQKLLVEYGYDEGLFVIFKKPLGDIFTALKLSAMDVSNGLQRIVKAVWHLGDPAKLKEDKKVYDQKRSNIMRQWDPIVKDSMEAIKSADPFLMVGLFPQTFLAIKGAEAAVALTKTAVEVGHAQNWEAVRDRYRKWWDDLGSGDGKDKPPGTPGRSDPSAIDAADELKAIRKLLEKLFYTKSSSNIQRNESLLREAEKDTGSIDPKKDPEGFMKQFLDDTGIGAELIDSAGALLQQKTELAKKSLEVLGQAVPFAKLIKTYDLETFKKTIQEILNSEGLSPELAKDFLKMIPKMEEQAKKMAESQEFKEKIAKGLKKPADQVSEDIFKKEAMNFVFDNSKKKFNEEIASKIKAYIPVLEDNDKDITLDSKTLKAVKDKAEDLFSGPDFLKVYDKYEKAYKEFKTLVK